MWLCVSSVEMKNNPALQRYADTTLSFPQTRQNIFILRRKTVLLFFVCCCCISLFSGMCVCALCVPAAMLSCVSCCMHRGSEDRQWPQAEELPTVTRGGRHCQNTVYVKRTVLLMAYIMLFATLQTNFQPVLGSNWMLHTFDNDKSRDTIMYCMQSFMQFYYFFQTKQWDMEACLCHIIKKIKE